MLGFFRKKTEKEKLEARYDHLIKKSYQLSHTNRAESDKIAAEAADLLKQIDDL
ncbi:MAG: Lacal_2735 family protein [Bacteroidota bacterium]|nr:Lacal_2735 family protein [Bacteroidota bacterium]